MSTPTRVTITAGVATLLGAIPLAGGFAQQRWFIYAALAVAVVTLVGILMRLLRTPAVLIVPFQLAGLLVFHTVVFAGSDGYGNIIPNSRTVSDLMTSLSDGLHDVQYLAAPVPARTDIVILTSLSVGLLAIVVDMIAVSAARPAVAGLALLALFAVATAVSARTLFFEFAGAGAGYLLLLAVEGRERLVRWGRVVTADDPAGGGTAHAAVRIPRHSAAGRVGVVAVAAALIIPALVPGFTRNVLGNLGDHTGTGIGGTQTLGTGIDPFTSLKGSLQDSNTINVMKVKSSEPPFYLRVTVLDEYTPAGWRRGHTSDGSSAVDDKMPVPGDVSRLAQQGHTKQVTAKVEITNYASNRLPVYYAPSSVTGAGKDWSYDTTRAEVKGTRDTQAGMTYTVKAQEPDPTVQELQASPAIPAKDAIMQRWGAKPEVTPVVNSITRQVITGDKSPWARANAIYNWFTNGTQGFTYSLQTKAGNSADALENFLKQKQGYCEQYASAMAVMLRLAHIPSRVVLGYAQGVYDGTNKVYDITNKDAHAWVEGYFQGIGWVEFDPTPRDDGHTTPPSFNQPTGPQSSVPGASHSAAASGTTSRAAGAAQTTDPAAGGPTTTGGGSSGGSSTPATVGTALGILAALALLFTPALVRRIHRRGRFGLARGSDAGLAAHACWTEMSETLTDLGIAPVVAESPRATAARLIADQELDPPAASAVSILALAEERARYAAEAGVDADLPTALRAVRAGLLAGAGRWRRIWITVLPPSVLQNARLSMAAGSARVSTAVADLGRVLRLRGTDH